MDIKSETELEKTWKRFFCRSHHGIYDNIGDTWILRHPRRSGEALAMATLQNAPWRENRFPRFKSLPELQTWIAPLAAEEKKGQFTGMPCPSAPNAVAVEVPTKSTAIDWVLGWLRTMCKGEIIPPLCVEIVLKDGVRYFLHSILAFEDETKTICARMWDLRALAADEIEELKQRLNQIRSRKNLAPAESVQPKLDWANLHLHYDDVAYCVEWHDRIWPLAGKPRAKVAKRKKK